MKNIIKKDIFIVIGIFLGVALVIGLGLLSSKLHWFSKWVIPTEEEEAQAVQNVKNYLADVQTKGILSEYISVGNTQCRVSRISQDETDEGNIVVWVDIINNDSRPMLQSQAVVSFYDKGGNQLISYTGTYPYIPGNGGEGRIITSFPNTGALDNAYSFNVEYKEVKQPISHED